MPENSYIAPYALAMIIADAVWQDPATGKRTILGTFSAIGSRQFPAVHPLICLHVVLTDGRGKVPLRVQLVDVQNEDEVIFRVDSEQEFNDPRMVVEMDIQFQNVPFPHAGEYRFQIMAGDDVLMERRLILQQIPSG